MQFEFSTLKKSRELITYRLKNLSIEQLNKVPNGFTNSIAWNIGHMVVTQQLLCYKLSGLPCLVSEELIEKFQKGTFAFDVSLEEFEMLKKLFLELPEKLEIDVNNGIFKNYISYKTSVDITLTSINDAISFNNYHEGIHLGIILQLLKFI